MEAVLWNSLLANGGVVIKQEYNVNDVCDKSKTMLEVNLIKQEAELVIEDTIQGEKDPAGLGQTLVNHTGLPSQCFPSISQPNFEVCQVDQSTRPKASDLIENSDRKLFIHLLSSWNIKEEKINQLLELGFMVNDLKIITNEDIKDLFTSSDIVTRIRFRDGVTRVKESGIDYFNALEIQDDNLAGNETSTLISSKEVNLLAGHELPANHQNLMRFTNDLRESKGIDQLLLKTMRGKQVLKHYKKHKYLSGQHQKIITDIVVDGLVKRQERLKCSDFIECAEKILATFPTESRDIFFFKGKNGRHRGKLVDRYYNVIKKLRKKGLWKTIRKTKYNLSKSTEQNHKEIVRLQLMTCNDWGLILKYWAETFNYRMSINRQKSMMEICNYWKNYNDRRGIELIELDYNLLFPGVGNHLFVDWKRYIEKWKQMLMNCNLHHPNDLFYKRLMTEQLSENTENYLIFLLLHTLLPPNCIINHVTNKRKIWRPCTTNSQNSITIHVLAIQNDITPKIDEIKTIYLKYGLDMHPFIIVTGSDMFNYSESFVYINDNLHRTESFLKSLDLCFKIYKIFHLDFPRESALVWQLIERLFYKTEQDVTEPPVLQLLLSLG